MRMMITELHNSYIYIYMTWAEIWYLLSVKKHKNVVSLKQGSLTEKIHVILLGKIK